MNELITNALKTFTHLFIYSFLQTIDYFQNKYYEIIGLCQ